MKVSDILRDAADKFLWDGMYEPSPALTYSCDAVLGGAMGDCDFSERRYVRAFLGDLGVDDYGHYEFDEFEEGEERQGARFLWLDFAALVAEDEGL